MSTRKGLVLDAKILIRAVLGRRIRSLLEAHEDTTDFTHRMSALTTPVSTSQECSPVVVRIRKWVWRCSSRSRRW